MDMIDALTIADSAYDSSHEGRILKSRASLNKEYGRTSAPVSDDADLTFELDPDGLPVYNDASDDAFADMIGIAPKTATTE